LPLPQRVPFTPNFQAFEVAKDSCRRAVQAAIGISPLPTAMQRQNEKSGIALEKIQQQEALGSFHFVDGYERGMERAGRIIESWIGVTYDTERDVALRKPDDTQHLVRANTEAPYVDQSGQPHHYVVAEQGDHGVTISTGPSNESQREAASDFLDSLISNLGKLPLAPPQAAKLLALAIQMKQLGPKGDEMAEIIAPAQDNGQGQILAAQQQQLAQQAQALQELQGELQQLRLEKQGKVIDNQYKMALEKMRIEAEATMAEINTKAQIVAEREKFVTDLWAQLHGQAHEVGMQAQDQAYEAQQAALDRQHEQGMAEQQAAIAQQQAEQEPKAA
jgi:hypothetical protein